MGKANGYFLQLTDEREEELRNALLIDDSFGEPVKNFLHSRKLPLICFLIRNNSIDRVASGRRGVKSGTGLIRLNLKSIKDITPAIPIGDLIAALNGKHKGLITKRIEGGGLLTEKSFSALSEVLIQMRPDLEELLGRYGSAFTDRINQMTSRQRTSLALQKQALLTVLALAQNPRVPEKSWSESIQNWTPPVQGAGLSFLDGLPSVRLREDPMVIHDFQNLPGFDLIRTLQYGAAVFESETSRVTVILANRLPLEEQSGADLIYFNEIHRCFVMVQYKAMEKEGEEHLFRLPNEQLNLELQRMDAVMSELSQIQSTSSCDGYRVNTNPFFLKLCKRIVFNPDDASQVDGMYIPLDYWKILSNAPQIQGPRGGRSVSYKNVGRYFDNSSFVSMVSNSWFGSTPEQSVVIEEAIRATLELGKAVMIAVKSNRTTDGELPVQESPASDELFG